MNFSDYLPLLRHHGYDDDEVLKSLTSTQIDDMIATLRIIHDQPVRDYIASLHDGGGKREKDENVVAELPMISSPSPARDHSLTFTSFRSLQEKCIIEAQQQKTQPAEGIMTSVADVTKTESILAWKNVDHYYRTKYGTQPNNVGDDDVAFRPKLSHVGGVRP
eukprot:PhF_6_TR34695/c0_g1_i1/m.50486